MENLLASFTWTRLAATALCFAAALYLVDTVHTWHRLSHVPGPFWPSISKCWMVQQSLKGRQPYAIQALNAKYGMAPLSALVRPQR